MNNRIDKREKMVLIMISGLLFFYPYITEGIMHNDELLARFWGMQGFFSFYRHYFNELLFEKGRALSSWIVPVVQYLGVMKTDTPLFKIMQLVSITSNVVIFGVFTNKVFHDVQFSQFVSLMLFLFLQISFESTTPNVFTTYYGFGLTIFGASLILYIDYLELSNTKYLLFSIICFAIAFCNSEAFVTYTPVYILLYVKESGLNKGALNNTIRVIVPVLSGCIFIIVYFIIGKIFPSYYNGNQICFTKSSFTNNIKELFRVSIPGGLLFSEKYAYLEKEYFHWLTGLDVMRVICVILFSLMYMVRLFGKQSDKESKNIRCIFKVIASTFVILSTAILPLLPVAVAKMYQGNIGEQGFLGVPVTYLAYYSTTLATCYIIWKILEILDGKARKIVYLLVLTCICTVVYRIQIRNAIFSAETSSNFERIQNIEKILSTEEIRNMGDIKIYSSDLFVTKNTLAVHDSYWSDFISLNKGSATVSNSEKDIRYSIYETNDEIFTLVDSVRNTITIFSKHKIEDSVAIKISNDEWILFVQSNKFTLDNDCFVYELDKM